MATRKQEKASKFLEMLRYDGKRVIVAGASSGMGRATAELLAELGAEVYALDVNVPEHVEYPNIHPLAVDLRNQESIERAVKEVGGAVNALIITAGLKATHPPLDILLVMFCGLRHLIEQVIPFMLRDSAITITTGGGSNLVWRKYAAEIRPLIETATFAEAKKWCEAHVEEFGKYGWGETKSDPEKRHYMNDVYVGSATYPFTKLAMHLYMVLKAVELKKLGIRINTECPGSTNTEMLADWSADIARATGKEMLKDSGEKLAQPEEHAWLQAFLNSSAAALINSVAIPADRGSAELMIDTEWQWKKFD
ncbi:MAG: SDR family NAD(P)-dependent oxidoreductase [Syntrophomonadaceae bacterium]|jgi:NAD(P)-dependent dehydrogenase (short-subunit alcohol dehydrogenase family)|nr:SDR family NAD(P)-dependent oxidoreductase [Syntrophomonadaceae bacterium]